MEHTCIEESQLQVYHLIVCIICKTKVSASNERSLLIEGYLDLIWNLRKLLAYKINREWLLDMHE